MPNKPFIFYLEDEPAELRYHLGALRVDYDVLCSAACQDVEMARSTPIALLIVDLMIKPKVVSEAGEDIVNVAHPGVDWRQVGLVFLEQVRQGKREEQGFGRDIPIVVATARPEEPIEARARAAGISDYLLKPFTIDELLAAVKKALEPKEGQADG
jgi:CheY-like chemotaxis protein